MRIISVINTSFTHCTKERSRQRSPVQVMAIAFAVSAFAFGNITFAAGGTAPDVSAALAAAVADYIADSGYFTRLFASVVGSKDHVYAVEPTAFFKFEHFVKAVGELQGYVEG